MANTSNKIMNNLGKNIKCHLKQAPEKRLKLVQLYTLRYASNKLQFQTLCKMSCYLDLIEKRFAVTAEMLKMNIKVTINIEVCLKI